MFRQLSTTLLITVLLSACANTQGIGEQTATTAPTTETDPAKIATPLDTVTDVPGAVSSARQALADLIGAVPGEVEMRSVEAVEWPDACLGLAAEGEMCAQVITPGYRMVFHHDGTDYEVRTNESGSQVRMATPDRVQPPGMNEPIDVQSWIEVGIVEAGLNFEVPEGWHRLEPAWKWVPEPGSPICLGVDWAAVDPPVEPVAAMLPENAVMLERVPFDLGWTTAYRYKLEVYAAAGEGEGETPPDVISVDYHILIATTAGDGRRVIDFYASAPSEDELATIEPLLAFMVRSLQPLTE